MKITNITKSSSKLSQELRLPLRKRGGINFTVVLKPGDSIFLEERNNNNILRIYEKKRYLSISNDKPHSSQSYYVVYTEAALNNVKNLEPVAKVKAVVKKLAKELVEEVSGLSVKKNVEEVLDTEMVEVEVLVPEGSVKESKGGRPKGSKNKSKRGRPKSKKSVGRPKKTSKK